MITRRDFSKSVLATGAALLATENAAPAARSSVPAADSARAGSPAKSPIASIRGNFGTPVTPFTSDDHIDGETFQKLVDFLIRHGFHAVAHPMHVGENLNMTIEERKLIAKLTVEAANGRVPVFVHASSSSTEEVVALSRHAQSIGAQGVVVVSPYFWQPPRDALIDHFVTVASSIDISVIGYNNLRTGVEITPDILAEIVRRCPNFIGIKEADLGMEHFTEVCRVTSSLRPGFGVYAGVEFTLPAMAAGGAGCFSPYGEVAPRLIKSLYDASAAGDYEKARPLQFKLSKLHHTLSGGFSDPRMGFGFAANKAARTLMGRPCGNPRKPLLPLDHDATKLLEAKLGELGILDDEPHGWA